MERQLDFKAIFECLSLNIIAAAGIFMATYSLTGSTYLAIMYTFISWSVTISISGGYWIWYLFRKIKADKTEKRNVAYFLAVMLASALLIVWWIMSLM